MTAVTGDSGLNRISPPARPVAIVTGTTASGKTGIAIDFALEHPEIEIVNADSLLIYRGFDVGTAKPTLEERKGVAHHLIDVREPDQPFTAGDFVREVERELGEIHSRGKRALIVGGTGFYLKALLFGLWDAPKAPPGMRERIERSTSRELYDRLMEVDEDSALRITQNDRYRLVRAWETIETTGKTPTALEAEAAARGSVPGLSLFVLDRDPEELRARIELRTKEMLAQGLIGEVERLRREWPGAKPFESVGYAEVVAYLEGRKPEGRKIADGIEGLESEIRLATTQLAKRQRTWFHGQFKRASDLEFFTLDRDRQVLEKRLASLYLGD
jgi:tRNA dimethylallyltransferase